MKKPIIFITFIYLCGYCANSDAQNKIHWFSNNEKDAVELIKPMSVAISTVTDTTRLLMAALPQYQFNIEFAHSPSIGRLLKKLPNSCAPNRVKTPERLKENTYSLPLNIALNLRLYYRADTTLKALISGAINNEQQLISIASLFTGKSTSTLGIDDGRSLGIFLDAQISSLEKHNLIIRSGGESTTSLVKMLSKNRIDYIIDYPISVNQALNIIPTDVALKSLEIAGSPDYIVGYVACSKDSIGQEIIKDINNALQKLYRSYDFYQAHTRYLDKADLADFNQAYQTIFKVDIPLKTVDSTL
ncbi:hypothetical protein [Colwellia psychrerythraea]|uniref:Solute-binding protein family 3/N-terminal domain-containing protein n=1 Tax=Colwellia psychrerythraea TaxID=28229 RepID=A0A099KL67_COLPS|nr:hypothetical protein [Colwellia psychrerythraea]KGJ91156.1 hypothetical protein GAB14E_3308 [Colwellia psychrerythraea]